MTSRVVNKGIVCGFEFNCTDVDTTSIVGFRLTRGNSINFHYGIDIGKRINQGMATFRLQHEVLMNFHNRPIFINALIKGRLFIWTTIKGCDIKRNLINMKDSLRTADPFKQ